MKQPLLVAKTIFIICLSAVQAWAQSDQGSLSGTVRGPQGEPLPGATLQLVDTELGRTTDGNGRFNFPRVPSGTYTLRISFVGYATGNTSVTISSGEQTQVNVQLEEEDFLLEGLVITAQRRNQSAQETPVAVTTYEGRFLRENNVREFDAISELVPGLQVQLQSPNNPGFVVRGITSDDGDSRVEPRVSVFQDGVSISKSRGSVVELYDLERVEVLKGPQGTLFGRGAQIGAVHLIQNKAVNRQESEVILGYGNFNQFLAQGFVNVPLIEDKFFARVAAIYNRRDGFIENIAGGDLNGKETAAVRGSFRYVPTSKTVVDLIMNYQRDTPPGTSFKSGTFPPRGGDLSPFTAADLERGEDLFINRTVWGTTLLVDHVLGRNWGFNSITAYREFDSFESFDADGTAAPVLWFAEEAQGQQFSQEFRFNFSNQRRLNGFLGTSYFYEKGRQRVPFETNEQSYVPLLSPLINQANPAFPVIPLTGPDGVPNFLPAIQVPTPDGLVTLPLKEFHREQTTNFGRLHAFEVFADATYRLTPALGLTAGLRGTYENAYGALETPVAEVPGTVGFLLNTGDNNLFPPTDGREEAQRDFFSYVGRLILDYEVSQPWRGFVSISRGRRPNVINVQPGVVTVLDNEIVWSYEAGAKYLSPGGRFQFDINGFYYDYFNFQTNIARLTETGIVFDPRDSGKARALGFETSFRGNITRRLNVFANYAYVDARFADQDVDGTEQELAGNRFRLTPEHSGAVGLILNLPINDRLSFFFRPSYSYKSQVFFEEENQPGVEQAGYGLLNVRTGLNFGADRYQIALYGNNLLDEQYLIDAGNTGGAFGIPTFIAGPPRLFGIQLTGRF